MWPIVLAGVDRAGRWKRGGIEELYERWHQTVSSCLGAGKQGQNVESCRGSWAPRHAWLPWRSPHGEPREPRASDLGPWCPWPHRKSPQVTEPLAGFLSPLLLLTTLHLSLLPLFSFSSSVCLSVALGRHLSALSSFFPYHLFSPSKSSWPQSAHYPARHLPGLLTSKLL